jgi:hypothetical protein
LGTVVALVLTDRYPESIPESNMPHGSLKVDWVAVWFPVTKWKMTTSPRFAETLVFYCRPSSITWGERRCASLAGGIGKRSIVCDQNCDGIGPDASSETQESRSDSNETHISSWRRGGDALEVSAARTDRGDGRESGEEKEGEMYLK